MKKLPLFDSHAHLDVEDFDRDREELLRSIGESMAGIIDPGCDILSSRMALDLAHQYPFVWAAVGIHPEEIGHSSLEDLAQIEAWCADPRVVAIGEIGLDYYNDEHSPHDQQQEFLIRQLDLARKTGLPVIIHDRDSHEDVLRIIREEGKGVQGVLHCFSGDWAMAEEALAMGWYLGFGGTSTFKNDRGVRSILARVPEDRILFETDSPYMAPVPYRGKRNNPLYTAIVAERAAELRGTTPEKIMESSLNNVKKLFLRVKTR
ncbi:TatD family hydrolase [uncultured Acidaminococcus sp.]|uniref:TatD family hydrolase n=1 Tax=uncultured Acidaminococcus sp. TaxID=352152 RepID=UPI0026128816|nr:TatD family hydrolase [uncultured Acidaminococcus sp.]